MRRRHQTTPSPSWQTFLTTHAGQIMAADFFVVPTVTFRLLFVLVVLAHDRRRITHVAVTAHPTAAWTAQQLRNAFPEDQAPRYLVHDRDGAFASVAATIAHMNIEAVRTAPRSPWQNAYVELKSVAFTTATSAPPRSAERQQHPSRTALTPRAPASA